MRVSQWCRELLSFRPPFSLERGQKSFLQVTGEPPEGLRRRFEPRRVWGAGRGNSGAGARRQGNEFRPRPRRPPGGPCPPESSRLRATHPDSSSVTHTFGTEPPTPQGLLLAAFPPGLDVLPGKGESRPPPQFWTPCLH